MNLQKRCASCLKTKPRSDYNLERKKLDGHKSRCRDCSRKDCRASYQKHRRKRIQASSDWKKNHPQQQRKINADRIRRRRAQIVDGYGGKCTCCGERTIAFLTLEHKNGGGRAHRKLCGSSNAVYRDVINKNFPADYTVLCMNCNFATRGGQQCPHNQLARTA